MACPHATAEAVLVTPSTVPPGVVGNRGTWSSEGRQRVVSDAFGGVFALWIWLRDRPTGLSGPCGRRDVVRMSVEGCEEEWWRWVGDVDVDDRDWEMLRRLNCIVTA